MGIGWLDDFCPGARGEGGGGSRAARITVAKGLSHQMTVASPLALCARQARLGQQKKPTDRGRRISTVPPSTGRRDFPTRTLSGASAARTTRRAQGLHMVSTYIVEHVARTRSRTLSSTYVLQQLVNFFQRHNPVLCAYRACASRRSYDLTPYRVHASRGGAAGMDP